MIQTKLLYFAVSALFGLLCAYTQQLMVYILYFLFIGWLLLMKKGSWKLAAFLLCTFFLFVVRGSYDYHGNSSKIKEDTSSFSLLL